MAAEVIRTLIGDPLRREGKATLERQPSSKIITMSSRWVVRSPFHGVCCLVMEWQWSFSSALPSFRWATSQGSSQAHISGVRLPKSVLGFTIC